MHSLPALTRGGERSCNVDPGASKTSSNGKHAIQCGRRWLCGHASRRSIASIRGSGRRIDPAYRVCPATCPARAVTSPASWWISARPDISKGIGSNYHRAVSVHIVVYCMGLRGKVASDGKMPTIELWNSSQKEHFGSVSHSTEDNGYSCVLGSISYRDYQS